MIVYRKNGTEEIYECLKKLGEEQEGEYNILIAGDLNARIGREGGNVGWEGEIVERRSKDEVINEDGKKLLEIVRENGWQFLNGNKTGDEEGEYTYIGGRGATAIDYVVTNTGAWDRIKEMRVGERTESVHMPLVVELWQEEEEIQKKEKGKKRVFTVWDNEAKDMYRKRLEEAEMKESEVKKIWEKLKKLIDSSMVKKEIYSGKRKEEVAWFDEECKRSKRQVGRIYKKFRSGKKDREEYIAERRRHRELCKTKREKRKEEVVEEVKAVKTESEAWKIINKYRKKRTRISNEIPPKKWKEYFMNLLGGKEQGEAERRIRKRREEDDERDLTTEEIEEQIQKLKKKRRQQGKMKYPEELKRRGEKMSEKVKEREIEVDRQTLHGKIQRAKYNERYKEIEPHTQLPEYLRKEGKNMEMKRKPRARCGSLEESNRYWEKEENRNCRLCKEELGTIRHLIRECKELKRTALKEQDIVAEESKEEVMEWCRELEKKRKELQITDIG
ncbi:hypothetical protein WN55_08624 [Dufourea novaeangliae]|uniref:Endonuclease/exonuclease/phosphatase domain-containing protein n=1 Tax=Dufourea novaeangliae TaxID=178035 RepID=A0A154PT07_DUFNO|nr:hypothetical protein WN55_08624 [Dufourea novaeangliae]